METKQPSPKPVLGTGSNVNCNGVLECLYNDARSSGYLLCRCGRRPGNLVCHVNWRDIKDVVLANVMVDKAVKPSIIAHVDGLVFDAVTVNGKRVSRPEDLLSKMN